MHGGLGRGGCEWGVEGEAWKMVAGGYKAKTNMSLKSIIFNKLVHENGTHQFSQIKNHTNSLITDKTTIRQYKKVCVYLRTFPHAENP